VREALELERAGTATDQIVAKLRAASYGGQQDLKRKILEKIREGDAILFATMFVSRNGGVIYRLGRVNPLGVSPDGTRLYCTAGNWLGITALLHVSEQLIGSDRRNGHVTGNRGGYAYVLALLTVSIACSRSSPAASSCRPTR
jgi:hypothetical protein